MAIPIPIASKEGDAGHVHDAHQGGSGTCNVMHADRRRAEGMDNPYNALIVSVMRSCEDSNARLLQVYKVTASWFVYF